MSTDAACAKRVAGMWKRRAGGRIRPAPKMKAQRSDSTDAAAHIPVMCVCGSVYKHFAANTAASKKPMKACHRLFFLFWLFLVVAFCVLFFFVGVGFFFCG